MLDSLSRDWLLPFAFGEMSPPVKTLLKKWAWPHSPIIPLLSPKRKSSRDRSRQEPIMTVLECWNVVFFVLTPPTSLRVCAL